MCSTVGDMNTCTFDHVCHVRVMTYDDGWQAIYGISDTVKWCKSIILETNNSEELLKHEVHCWFWLLGLDKEIVTDVMIYKIQSWAPAVVIYQQCIALLLNFPKDSFNRN